ncbi:MAG: hypothetical protein EOO50_09860 [Flavobacterium sp.]|uniref:hypothetical protein n=1 Tax=Flavobacterium sp. TaxID=239 RepID=UPI00120F8A1E|nr:hypothetical protein [Flavobacterium sp.]RZJ66371.1 MAG: hypothetical protein EOO50_09860 [Flavobacterium sp.]
MKKLILLFVSAAVLQSCNSDDSDSPAVQGKLLQSTVQTVNGESTVTNYSYIGNKISTVQTVGGDKVVYIYSGSKIVSMTVENSFGNDVFQYEFDYTGDKMTQVKRWQVGTGSVTRQVFTYPDATSITSEGFTGNTTQQTQLLFSQIYSVGANGEIESVQTTQGDAVTVSTYTYDAKNNPFKNITGYADLLMLGGTDYNVLSVISTLNGNPAGSEATIYTYDSDDFPATSTRTSFGTEYETTYTYQ